MLSAKKQQLAIAVRFAICISMACIIVAIYSSTNECYSKLALPVVHLALGTMFYLALLIAGLTTELHRSLGKAPSTSGEDSYSSISEIRTQMQWSPRSYKVASLVGIVGILGTAVIFGAVSWSTNEPFTSRHAKWRLDLSRLHSHY